MNIILIIGTRPNYMKAYPLYNKLKKTNNNIYLIHTGQHYDNNMNKIFLEEFKLKPDIQFRLESKNESEQLGEIIINLSKYFIEIKPDIVIVFGDVTSTLAGGLVANKMGIKLVHIESGLRSYDNSMPEEINRILVDKISDIHIITEESGIINLEKEGIKNNYLVGNTMIDTLIEFLPEIRIRNYNNKLNISNYIVLTLHRQSNVNNINKLNNILEKINNISNKYSIKIIYPKHPRIKEVLDYNNIKIIEPLGYIDFMSLINNSRIVITDSGGIQEETTFLNIPCLTLRNNTERPFTLIENGGTNKLININNLEQEIDFLLKNKINKKEDKLNDGKVSDKIINIIFGKIQ